MRIKMIVQYLGTNYAGWQVQSGQKTIQGELETAIFKCLGEYCETTASGRTDAGVHAWGQTVHFDTNTKIAPNKLSFAINRFLPSDIRILNSCQVSDDFNARFDVKQKTYEYYFYANEFELPLLSQTYAKVRSEFNYEIAKSHVNDFIGTFDFVGFCSSHTQVKTTVRTIYDIQLIDLGENKYKLSVTGNGFLYNMVRIIAGTIIDIGCGKINPNDLLNIIKSKNRKLAGKTASANGLILKEVRY